MVIKTKTWPRLFFFCSKESAPVIPNPCLHAAFFAFHASRKEKLYGILSDGIFLLDVNQNMEINCVSTCSLFHVSHRRFHSAFVHFVSEGPCGR